MISNIYWINDDKIGRDKLGTMARPRGNDWLYDEIKFLKSKEISCLVSLLESSEELELELKDEGRFCSEWKVEFINFPIRDISTPKNESEFINLARKLAAKVNRNEKVVIHCRMGIGRSSMLAAAVMIILGCDEKKVFEIIGKYRKLNVPDTKEQKDWVFSITKKLKENSFINDVI